jgi:hypothetical protein
MPSRHDRRSLFGETAVLRPAYRSDCASGVFVTVIILVHNRLLFRRSRCSSFLFAAYSWRGEWKETLQFCQQQAKANVLRLKSHSAWSRYCSFLNLLRSCLIIIIQGTRPFYKLSQIRWAWSDVRLWNDIDRVLRSTPAYEPAKPRPSSADPPASSPLLQPSSSTASSSSSASQGTAISKPKKQKSKSKSRERRNRGDSRTSPSLALSRPQSPARTTPTIPTSLTEAWKVYEDMCLVCANAWMGTLCARAGGGPLSPSASQTCLHPSEPCSIPPAPIDPPTVPPVTVTEAEPSGKSTAVHLEGDDDILLRTVRSPAELSPGVLAKMRDASSSSCATYTSGQTLVGDEAAQSKPIDAVVLGALPVSTAIACEALSIDHATTLNLLHTFDRYASWQIGVLRTYIKSLVGDGASELEEGSQLKLTLTPRDMVLLDLNPLSSGDVKYLEALLKEYAGHVVIAVQGSESGEEPMTAGQAPRLSLIRKGKATREVTVDLVVKRGWKDLFGVVFGFA